MARLTASASGLTPLSISEMHIDSSLRSRWQFCIGRAELVSLWSFHAFVRVSGCVTYEDL